MIKKIKHLNYFSALCILSDQSVYWGAALGGAASLAFATVILSIYYSTSGVMDPKDSSMLEAIMLGFASIAITYFFITHLAPGYGR